MPKKLSESDPEFEAKLAEAASEDGMKFIQHYAMADPGRFCSMVRFQFADIVRYTGIEPRPLAELFRYALTRMDRHDLEWSTTCCSSCVQSDGYLNLCRIEGDDGPWFIHARVFAGDFVQDDFEWAIGGGPYKFDGVMPAEIVVIPEPPYPWEF